MISRSLFRPSFFALAGTISALILFRATLTPAPDQAVAGRTYVGSKACAACHASVYERWSKTRMANVVTDPREHPEAVIPDFSKPDPLLTFKLDDVAFV